MRGRMHTERRLPGFAATPKHLQSPPLFSLKTLMLAVISIPRLACMRTQPRWVDCPTESSRGLRYIGHMPLNGEAFHDRWAWMRSCCEILLERLFPISAPVPGARLLPPRM